jgi:transposase
MEHNTAGSAEPLFVGVDAARDRLDIAVLPSVEVFATGRDNLLARLRPLAPALVAPEATGGFGTVAAATLGAAGLPVAVLNPAEIRAFATAIGPRAKTDPIDPRLIPGARRFHLRAPQAPGAPHPRPLASPDDRRAAVAASALRAAGRNFVRRV